MTLAERSARSGIGHPDLPTRNVAATPGAQAPVRHCWVVDAPISPGRWPGLLVEWRRTEQGWQGRAVWVAEDDDGPVLLNAWVSSRHLSAGAP